MNTGLLTELETHRPAPRGDRARDSATSPAATWRAATRRCAARAAIALIGMLGAAAAAVGGSPEAGVAIATGTGQAAHRSALAHSRAEEASADQAGLRYLAAAGSDPQAMLEVLGHFRGQEALLGACVDPYAQNHPLWSERIALIEDRVAQAAARRRRPRRRTPTGTRRMVAKLDAFLDSPAPDAAQLSRERRLRDRRLLARARRLAPPARPGRGRRRASTR